MNENDIFYRLSSHSLVSLCGNSPRGHSVALKQEVNTESWACHKTCVYVFVSLCVCVCVLICPKCKMYKKQSFILCTMQDCSPAGLCFTNRARPLSRSPLSMWLQEKGSGGFISQCWVQQLHSTCWFHKACLCLTQLAAAHVLHWCCDHSHHKELTESSFCVHVCVGQIRNSFPCECLDIWIF